MPPAPGQGVGGAGLTPPQKQGFSAQLLLRRRAAGLPAFLPGLPGCGLPFPSEQEIPGIRRNLKCRVTDGEARHLCLTAGWESRSSVCFSAWHALQSGAGNCNRRLHIFLSQQSNSLPASKGTGKNNFGGSVCIPVSIECCFATQLTGESYQQIATKQQAKINGSSECADSALPEHPAGAVARSPWGSPVQPLALSRSVAGTIAPISHGFSWPCLTNPGGRSSPYLSVPCRAVPPGGKLSCSPCVQSPSLRGQLEAGVDLPSDSPASSHQNVTLPHGCFLYLLPNPGLSCQRLCERSAPSPCLQPEETSLPAGVFPLPLALPQPVPPPFRSSLARTWRRAPGLSPCSRQVTS